jgi:DNA replication protein DnaC
MKTADPADAARVELFLADLRPPAIKQMWATLAEQSNKEGWPAARFLAALAEHEIADRDRRRIHLAEARLPVGKTLDSFDCDAVPMVSKAQVMALTAGDNWLEKRANLLLFGPPDGGKSHLAAAIGLALIENGWRVLFTRTSDLVQRPQIARRGLALESAIAKLDKYHLGGTVQRDLFSYSLEWPDSIRMERVSFQSPTDVEGFSRQSQPESNLQAAEADRSS